MRKTCAISWTLITLCHQYWHYSHFVDWINQGSEVYCPRSNSKQRSWDSKPGSASPSPYTLLGIVNMTYSISKLIQPRNFLPFRIPGCDFEQYSSSFLMDSPKATKDFWASASLSSSPFSAGPGGPESCGIRRGSQERPRFKPAVPKLSRSKQMISLAVYDPQKVPNFILNQF